MQLVPFRYHGLKTSEAVWSHAGDITRRLRFTRKGWGEMFGAKQPQNYIDKMKDRHPDLPEGIPVTVTGMTGQKYTVYTLDIYEGFQYATYSDLLRAKEFVRRFPDFLTAVMKGEIPQPPADIALVATMPKWHRGKGDEIKRLAVEENVTEMTIRRRIQRVEKGEPINKKKAPYVHHKYRAIYNDAIQLRKEGLTGLEITRKLNIPHQTVYPWFKKISLN